MTDLVIRALTEGDAHLFHTLSDPALVGRGRFGHTYATLGQGGEYRPEWTWVALRGERVVARAAWWSGPEDTAPVALDWFDFAEGEAGAAAELLRTAPLRAEYCLLAPPGWRDRPEESAAVRARIDAAVAGGFTPLVERYRYEWTPGLGRVRTVASGQPAASGACDRKAEGRPRSGPTRTSPTTQRAGVPGVAGPTGLCGHAPGLPERPGRLEFRPEPDDEVIAGVLRRVHQGTLDAHDRRTIAEGGIEAAVAENLRLFHWFPSPRAWWRLAWTPGGELVGIHVPAHNPAGPCVGFIGVVAEQRGHGYAYDLLAECTHDLVERGATRIAAATDRGNRPMAAHFARAGYPVTQERIDLV